MFNKILIANRGEIVHRISRSAKKLGISTIGVYAPNDLTSAHLKAVNVAVPLKYKDGLNPYLDIDQLITVALNHNVDAIHPGYGFLSERASFAKAVTEAGIRFIGPSAEVIDLMGRKDAARTVAESVGMPLIPYYEVSENDVQIKDSDFPVLIKAAAGGGGKGMKIVRSANELTENLESARREALNAFGSDVLIIEKFIETARHLEVQVLFDEHGNGVHLFDRECSVQRRHQKIIEEAPAPKVPEKLRNKLFNLSLELCKKVGYSNAGTLEFIFDGTQAYFLEMNTRIQVEHCVTEEVTGVDLVEQQILIALGKPLELTQHQIELNGHAVETRVYAENAEVNFLPQAGKANFVKWPKNIRVEASLESGQDVSSNYDPMVGKLIAHGSNREEAIEDLIQAIDTTAIEGVTHNLGFVRNLLGREDFLSSTLSTNTLDSQVYVADPDQKKIAAVLAGFVLASKSIKDAGTWRLNSTRRESFLTLSDSDRVFNFKISPEFLIALDNENYLVETEKFHDDFTHYRVNGISVLAFIRDTKYHVFVHLTGCVYVFNKKDRRKLAADSQEASGVIRSLMPGTLVSVNVSEGEQVEAGQLLIVMEAMKMENRILAPFNGTVVKVTSSTGAKVSSGVELIEISPMVGA